MGENEEVKTQEVQEKSMDRFDVMMTGVTSYQEVDAIEKAQEAAEDIEEDVRIFPELARNIMSDPDTVNVVQKITNLGSEFVERVKMHFSGNEEKERTEEIPEETKQVNDRNGVFIYKDDSSDLYKFICCYSNNFRDDDTPAEIISAKSHKRFVEMVDKGLADYPVLQIWHEDAWTVGKTTCLFTDEREDGSCFAMGAGYFFKGMEPVAEALMGVEDLRMSHGMPVVSIKRNADDQTIIDEHISKEITVLPGGAEANRWTYFNPIMEDKKEMTIPQAKREAVKQQFDIDENVLDMIESQNAATAAKNIQAKIELKEKEVQEPEIIEEPTEEVVEEVKELPITREEIVEGFQTLAAQIMKGVEEKIGELRKEQKTEEEIIKEQIKDAPMFSVSSMLRATQSEDTKMKQAERSNGPAETKETGSSVADIINKGGGFFDVLKSVTQSQE